MRPRRRLFRLRNRWRLTAWIVLVVTVVIVVAGFAAATMAERRFTADLDDSLRREVSGVAAAVDVFGVDVIDELSELQPDRLAGADHAMVIVGPDGVEAALASGNAEETDPLPDLAGRSAADLRARAGEIFEVDAVEGDTRYRAIATQLPDGRIAVLAAPLNDLEDALRALGGVLVVVTIIAAVVLVVVVALVSAYVTRPLDGMIATAEEVGGGSFSSRIESDGTEDVDRLAGALNAMLDRVQGALSERDQSEATLRRFIADASHELRTPLTAIIGYTELHLTEMANSPEQIDRSFTRINSEAQRMHRLVEDMLALARLDQQPLSELEPVDLAALVSTSVSDAETIDNSRPITLEVPGVAMVDGDALLLRQSVDNLLANTRAHTPPGTAVSVTLTAVDDHVELVVADDGPGIDPDNLDHIFERFHRVDPARSRSGGAGLGLAIVATAIERHHGTVRADSSPGEGTTITITLPV